MLDYFIACNNRDEDGIRNVFDKDVVNYLPDGMFGPVRGVEPLIELWKSEGEQIDLSFGYLRRGRVASKIWTEIGSGRRVLRQGRCIAITSDNGGGFKFAPLAAKEACHLVLAE